MGRAQTINKTNPSIAFKVRFSGLGFLRCRWTFACGNVAVGRRWKVPLACRWTFGFGHVPLGWRWAPLEKCRWSAVGHFCFGCRSDPKIYRMGCRTAGHDSWTAGPQKLPRFEMPFWPLAGRWKCRWKVLSFAPSGAQGPYFVQTSRASSKGVGLALAWDPPPAVGLPLGCRWPAVGPKDKS